MNRKKTLIAFTAVFMVVAICALVACNANQIFQNQTCDAELSVHISASKDNDTKRTYDVNKNLEIVESQIGNVEQTTIKNIQNYKNKLKHDFAGISDYDLALKLLQAVGYSDCEIEKMNDQTKLAILSARNVAMQRSATSDLQGLNFNVTYTTITLTPSAYDEKPVDYYLVRATWSWENPTLVGAPDYIGIKLQDGLDYYQLIALAPDDELACYEYCNLSYNKKVYNGTEITTTYNLTSQVGQAENENPNLKSRTFVMDMPANDIQYEQPGDPLVYKTIYTDFVGEAQFLLKIKYSADESYAQNVGVTYGHSEQECTVTYSESVSTSLGFSAGVEGPSGELGLGISSNWEYSESTVINSEHVVFCLVYDKITIEDGKVYNIINQNYDKALECPAGVTQAGTQLRLADERYKYTENKTQVANWQWRVELNKTNNNIILHPVLDDSKHLAFQYDRAVLEDDPAIVGFSSNITSPIRIQSSDELVPQYNYVIKRFKLQGGENYSYLMNCANDFYSSVGYAAIGQTSDWKSSWLFYEVPEEDVAEESPTEFSGHNFVSKLKNVGTQKVMDVCNNSIDNGATVLVYDEKTSSVYDDPALYNQFFKITNAGNNAFYLSPFHVLGFNLDIQGASSAVGAKLQTYVTNGTSAQRFRFYPVSKTDNKVQFYIATTSSGYSLVLTADSDTTISQKTPSNDANQLWEAKSSFRNYLNFNTNDSYCIRNIASRYYFDVNGNSSALNASVIQYYFSGSDNQRMKFVPNGDGSYYIVPQHATNRVLELSDNQDNGNQLKIYSQRSDKAYQRFKFVRAKNNRFYILTGASGYNKALAVGDVGVANRIVQYDRQDNTLSHWAIDLYDDTSINDIIKLDSVKKINVNGTTEQTLLFSVPYFNNYTIETVGVHNMTLTIYWDSDGDGVYELLSENTTGGRDDNAAYSFFAAGDYRIKISTHGASGNNGVAGVLLFKVI